MTRTRRLRTLAERFARRASRSTAPLLAAADGRRYEQLTETADYDAWMIWWPPGGQLDLHDHGGSSGAVRMVIGELDEHIAGAGRTMRRRLQPGDVVTFGRRHVHALTNPGATTAVSIDVYSPPLRSMAFYRSDREGDLVTAKVTTADDWARA